MLKRFSGTMIAALLLCAASAQAADYKVAFVVNWFYGSPPFHSATGYAVFSEDSVQGSWNELKDFELTIGNAHYAMADVGFGPELNGRAYVGGLLAGPTGMWPGTNDFYASFDRSGLRVFSYTSLNIWGGLWSAGSMGSNVSALPVAAVPEPGTYAMLLAGLGLMGVIARHRKA
jgi:opacity protein-like surface antigen